MGPLQYINHYSERQIPPPPPQHKITDLATTSSFISSPDFPYFFHTNFLYLIFNHKETLEKYWKRKFCHLLSSKLSCSDPLKGPKERLMTSAVGWLKFPIGTRCWRRESTRNICSHVNQAKPNQTRHFLDVGVGSMENRFCEISNQNQMLSFVTEAVRHERSPKPRSLHSVP